MTNTTETTPQELTDWTEVAVDHYATADQEEWEIADSLASIRHYGTREYGGSDIVETAADRVEGYIRALTEERDQQAWDMRSLEATVENLRDALEPFARLGWAYEQFIDTDDDIQITGTVRQGEEVDIYRSDLKRARAALGEEPAND